MLLKMLEKMVINTYNSKTNYNNMYVIEYFI